ncbi:MAG: extensin family protein [Pararhodobacter sp.]|nr:extensin family protein [Pararhodobacter sp.]
MVPSRPETAVSRAEPPASSTQATPEQIRPEPRPPGLPAAPPSTAFARNGQGVELPPAPLTRAELEAAQNISPHAPAASLRPLRRSPAAFARHTEAIRRTERTPTTVAAGGSSGTGRVTGGLCGVSTLEGRRLPQITSRVQGCGVAEPVSVTAVAGIRLSHPATLDCDTARAFDQWVRQIMQPAMGRTGGGVAQIRVAAHYSCRPRNNRPGARVSEHGRGRAIDVSGFRLADGQTVSVLTDWRRGPHRNALRQMHANACGIFRTTLGPGSDGHHEDHFHYDMAQRRNNSTYCR